MTKTVREVSWSHLEDVVSEVYGHQFEMAANEEWSNDSAHEFTVTPDVDEWDRGKVDDFVKGTEHPNITGALLNDMCKRGLIEPGKYLVKVSW